MAEEDILFGKNRHMFGGVEPSNMKKFEVSVRNFDGPGDQIVIDAQLPDDTVVDGQTLCTVAGAVIRRKLNGYPIDEFDGIEVATIYGDSVFADETDFGEIQDVVYIASKGHSQYCYAAFPFTTQGVYNRNPVNTACINGSDKITDFDAVSIYDHETKTAKIQLTFTPPNGSKKIFVQRNTSHFPRDIYDGDLPVVPDGGSGLLLSTICYESTVTYEDVEIGKTYYFTLFPVQIESDNLRWIDTSGKNCAQISVHCARYNYLFGYDLDTTNPDPATRVTYPKDVMNYWYKPMSMNFFDGVFDYGDWPSKPGEAFMPKPCMITYEGKVAHYLDPNDYSKQEDGVTPSRVADSTFPGNAMMEWPKIYTYREEVDGVYKFRCSDMPQGEGWDCWCNYDDNDNVIDHFYTAIYASSYTDIESVTTGQALRSISGATIKTAYNDSEFRSYARPKINGSKVYTGWDISLLADHLLIQDLLVLVSKSTNSQKAFGYGFGNGNDKYTSNGGMDSKGMFWGSDVYTTGVKVFGMENLWGNNSRYIAGWYSMSGISRIKITRGCHDGVGSSTDTTSTKWNYFGSSGYNQNIKVNTSAPTGTNGGYISGMITLPYGRMPITVSGSATTYECDTFDWGTSTSSKSGYLVGGSSNKLLHNGIFAAEDLTTGSGTSGTCAYLSYKPLKE